MRIAEMNMKSLIAVALATAALFPTPTLAQRSSADPGNYWEVSDIDVLPGQIENYIDYLNKNWRKQQEFAKSKGYILDYHVLSNNYPRDGEPDLYLVVIFKDWPSNAEAKKQQDEFVAMMKQDEHQLAAASGERSTMRRQMGQALLQEVVFK
jgi:hypothetical protein